MNSKEYREVLIFALKYAQASKAAESVYSWKEKSKKDKDINDKIFYIVHKVLTQMIPKNQRDCISYYYYNILDSESMQIENNFIMKYKLDSDFDVLSIVEEVKRVVKSAFNNVDKVVKMTDGQVHHAKVILIHQACAINTKTEHILVSSELEKTLVEKIFSGVSVRNLDNKALKVNIDNEEIVMELPASVSYSAVSNKRKFMVVNVFCVDDKSLKVNLLDKHDGKIKVFYFDEVLRDELLEAQLSRTLVEVEIVINEKTQLGEDVEDGGKVVGLKKIEEDKLI